jgi:teichuronic acid exporter
MPDNLRQKVISGVVWRGLERIGSQVASFAVTIVLARLLEPKDFGTISMIAVFLAISQVFVYAGFGSALVQKKSVTEADYNSVFYLSITVAVFFYLVLFTAAPWIAAFYNEPILTGVLRLLALSLIVSGLNSVQTAVLNREMKFRLSFVVSLITMLVSAVIGIVMAYRGYGVWALVFSSLGGQVTTTVALWLVVKWRPVWIFSFSAIRQLFRFSSKLLAAALLISVFGNLYNVIIGKLYSPTVLGYYSRGQSIPSLMMSSVDGTISGVMFSALSSCQQDTERMKAITRRALKVTYFVTFPLMVGLAAVAQTLVLVVLSDKWLPCVPYLQLTCITFALLPLHTANQQVITALGRSDIYLVQEVLNKCLIIIAVLGTYRLGVAAMVIGQAAVSLMSVVINAWPNRRLIDYALARQIGDIAPSFLLSAGMGVAVWIVGRIIVNPYPQLGSQVVVGLIVYLAGAMLFRVEIANYLFRLGLQTVKARLGGVISEPANG